LIHNGIGHLDSREIIDYIDKKYTANGAANTTVQTGIAWALSENNVQAYFKIITTTSFDGTQKIEKLQVDQNTYTNIAAINNIVYNTGGRICDDCCHKRNTNIL
jgi:Txe/YoeB family toxin of Txe-Axe toxin-antitoxin module